MHTQLPRDRMHQVILTFLSGIIARRARVLLCLLFSRHILPAHMLGLSGIRRLDDPEASYFDHQKDPQTAINELNGKWLGNRQICCN